MSHCMSRHDLDTRRPRRTKVEVLANAHDEHARRVFLRLRVLVNRFPPLGSRDTTLHMHSKLSDTALHRTQGKRTYQNGHARARRAPDDEQQRDDDTDRDPDLDVPDDGQHKRERHERQVDPRLHPVRRHRHRGPISTVGVSRAHLSRAGSPPVEHGVMRQLPEQREHDQANAVIVVKFDPHPVRAEALTRTRARISAGSRARAAGRMLRAIRASR